ncbi:hypothetical protein ACF0H5_002903 [Mactra antiquata]
MAIYMPPITRKKKVLERYNPDTFRVISQHAEDTHLKHEFIEANEPSEWRRLWLNNEGLALPDIHNRKTEVLPKAVPDFRINRPHPGSCGFLRHNVRFLNEPICSVYTDLPKNEEQNWWPSRVSNEPLQVPPRTDDTIYRGDFSDKERPTSGFGSLRHTANPNKEPALGTVPVNFLRAKDGKQRFFKEKISYEHQYNSRNKPNYPIRGKRHGSFVWDQMTPENTKKFIDHYSIITAEEGASRQQAMEADKLATEAAKLLEGTDIKETSSCNQPKPCSADKKSSSPDIKPSSPLNTETQKKSEKTSCSPKNSPAQSPKKASSRKGSMTNGKNAAECELVDKTVECGTDDKSNNVENVKNENNVDTQQTQ